MDIDSILQPFQRFGVHLGLERIEKLLTDLGNPHHSVPVIHVAGTNGKGSVCAYLSAVLTEAGYRVGRYTSPHLIDWNERICLNEQPISLETLRELLLQVQAAIQPGKESPTQFEVITAAAWLYFYQQEVDVAVVEVGLGGRLDATNVCSNPLVTIITSISREHWQVLGPTLADIAREKAGILKPGCPAVIGQLPEEAIAVVKQRIVELGCPAVFPQAAVELRTAEAQRTQTKERLVEYRGIENLESNPNSDTPLNKEGVENPKSIRYPLPLLGDFQLLNSALAIASFQILSSQGWKITEQAIASGMEKTKWLGRLQWTTWKNRQLLIDGAHNPAAAIALRQYVDTLEKSPIHWVMGMLSTKDHADIFKALLREGEKLYLVPVPDHSSAETESLATLAQNICPQLTHCRIYPELTAGLEAAIAIATPDDLIVLCGSLYLIGHFLKYAK
ncbi:MULTISPECIES: bifunctional folylpolyglutamate synthase/dihydrofolate synthase [Cyanophyceae]|uniref:bifunctional folylpolyglutamate synthase/dihydrofolate synthase n=1 Tax=Cyanophyceae TaxID=3028117 RepID=UPI0016828F66|nr:folylpolyglutamate synthase/dihydrofolate synthase family protein [Trichocoleus sp. FACHB-69]MBD1934293.1 bifunctional folylpolyglutamate synthase/dihydrofolate synthase [Trichocoleus sp. FACHB-69]